MQRSSEQNSSQSADVSDGLRFANPSYAAPLHDHDRLSQVSHSGRQVFLHSESARSSKWYPGREHRCVAGLCAAGAFVASLPYRCMGGAAPPHALPLDTAGWRYGFLDALAFDQGLVFERLQEGEWRSIGRSGRQERGIWQRRFWEHSVRSDADYAAHMDYTHFNPVRHGLVGSPADWRFSSFTIALPKVFTLPIGRKKQRSQTPENETNKCRNVVGWVGVV